MHRIRIVYSLNAANRKCIWVVAFDISACAWAKMYDSQIYHLTHWPLGDFNLILAR